MFVKFSKLKDHTVFVFKHVNSIMIDQKYSYSLQYIFLNIGFSILKNAVTKNFPGSGNLSDFQITTPNSIGGSIVAK